jgi:GPH family glycoside/pentoside/hexuronide:cation symporter
MEQKNPVLVEEEIPLKSCVWVSAADAGVGILQNIIGGGALTYYFTRVMGLEPGLASLVWIIFGIWNAVNDPLFGYLSDKTKNKLGRRIPYIRYGAPIIALSFILLWLPFTSSQTGLFIQLLIGLFCYDLMYTAIATSIYIMPYEMAISNKARSRVFLWKIIFMTFSMGLPLTLLPLIQPGPGDDPGMFRWIMTGLGLLMGIIVFVSTWFYKEKHFHQEEEQYPFFKSIKESFSNKAFLIFLVVSFSVIYIQTALMQGVLYYFDEIKMPGMPIYISLGVGIIVGLVMWIRNQEKWGIKRCLMIWLGLFAIGCVLMLVFGRVLVIAMISFFLVGIGFAGGMYLIPMMNGDVVDYDEHRTRLRREGMYAGINSLVTKPAISIAQAVFLWFLSQFGYDQTLAKGMQSAQAQTGILNAWMLVPAILLLVSLVAMRWYPLAGEAWTTIKSDLSRQHEEKERAFLAANGFKAD